MAMITIRLPQELRDRIDKLAEGSGRTKSHFIRYLISRGVTDLEDELRELEEIRAAIRAGRPDHKTYSMEEVLERNGFTLMDLEMEPEGRKNNRQVRKVNSAKSPKKAPLAKPKRGTIEPAKTPKRK
jgi:RHH-type rel operon transcriptional repressor/antitoxin RelB